jgi:hypothetical protein
MIAPDEIRRKAESLYPKFQRAWLDGELFFPKSIPSQKRPADDLAAAAESVRRLRDGSKESLGYGYTIEWKEINSRRHGRNLFPQRIYFETQEDFLRHIGKQSDFNTFAEAVTKVRTRYPKLGPWIRSNRARLIKLAADVDGLLSVVNYLSEHPRPGLFARELPLPVDTKFVERHKGVLQQWLDEVLPPVAIRADEDRFERRFGLAYAERHLLVRFLDPDLQRECGCAWPEFSIPLEMLDKLPVTDARVMIVENKVNLLTLPPLSRTLALGGLGNSVTDLRDVRWLADCPIQYWGDLDAAGLEILARLRRVFPQTTSLLMDAETLVQWRDQLAEKRTEQPRDAPPGLTDAERDAFRICVEDGLRIEQERFSQVFVAEVLRNRARDSARIEGRSRDVECAR